jgi:uncharacterized repeat protein (TIGR04076 family)
MHQQKAMLELAKEFLQYTDKEMEMIQSNPKYLQIIEKVPQLMNTDFIFEVDEAHGCVCQHSNGQKIIINGDGSLDCSQSPAKICVHLLSAITSIINGAQEFIYAGLDPNELKFTKVGCLDNRAECGGFGHVTVKFSAQSK